MNQQAASKIRLLNDNYEWHGLNNINSRTYICGFCGDKINTKEGYFSSNGNAYIYICSGCKQPTFFDFEDKQFPAPLYGKDIKNLPEDIKKIYLEIRDSIKNNCFTGAILLGRKLIMHIAIDKAGAKPGKKFVEYINAIVKSDYLPLKASILLDTVRKSGNQKNHEIILGWKDEAEKILKFIELILTFIYEYVEIEEKIDS